MPYLKHFFFVLGNVIVAGFLFSCGSHAFRGLSRPSILTSEVAVKAEGEKEVPVVVKSADAEPTEVVVKKYPNALLLGAPQGVSSAIKLNVSVGGTHVEKYVFAVIEGSKRCEHAEYSQVRPISEAIAESIESMVDGPVTLCAKGISSDGNLQVTPTSVSWEKDTRAPALFLNDVPNGRSNAIQLSIKVDSSSGAEKYRFAVVEDASDCSGVAFSEPTALSKKIEENIAALRDGVITVCAVGIDAAGNEQSVQDAVKATWTKDTLAPIAEFASGLPEKRDFLGKHSVSLKKNDVVSFRYALAKSLSCTISETVEWKPVESPFSIEVGEAGEHSLCVQGLDGAGNVQKDPTHYTWTFFTTPGDAILKGVPPSPSNVTQLDIEVSGVNVENYRYAIVSGSDCNSVSAYSPLRSVKEKITDTLTIPDGDISVCVLGQTLQGEEQLQPTRAHWVKDTIAPMAIINGVPQGTSRAVLLDASVTGDDIVFYNFVLVQASQCPGFHEDFARKGKSELISESLASLADGNISLCVWATDDAGNRQPTPTVAAWIKDAIPNSPQVIGNYNFSVYENQSLTFNVTATDDHGLPLRYRCVACPEGLAVDATLGRVSWTPNYFQSGSHSVQLGVSNGTVETLALARIEVINVNREPQIPNIGYKSVNEGQSLSFAVTATDLDEETLSYSLSCSQPCAGLQVSSSGIVTWSPTYDQAGLYTITLRVRDGFATVTRTFYINVIDIFEYLQVAENSDSTVDFAETTQTRYCGSNKFAVAIESNGSHANRLRCISLVTAITNLSVGWGSHGYVATLSSLNEDFPKCDPGYAIAGMTRRAYGGISSIYCRELAVTGLEVESNGHTSQSSPIYAGNGHSCSVNGNRSFMVGLGSPITRDGVIDSTECRTGVRVHPR